MSAVHVRCLELLDGLVNAQPEERADTLRDVAFAFGQFLGGGVLPKKTLETLLQQARSLSEDVEEHTVNEIISSGLESGKKNPRKAPTHSRGADSATDAASESCFLPPPPPVPLEAFPDAVQCLFKEAADAFAVPVEIPVACFLAFLSCLVGRARLISVKPGWVEAANLWLVVVASSGVGKSPCMAAFFNVITKLEYDAKGAFDEAYTAYQTELAAYLPQVAFVQRARPQGRSLKPPLLKSLWIRNSAKQQRIDVTVEALGDILQANPKGVIWLKDELSGLLFDLDKYTSGREGGTKARLLSSHSLGTWKTNRVNSDRNHFIPKACLSIFGGLQPGMMSKAFEAGAGGTDIESGFLPRFLFIRSVAEAPAYWSERIFSNGSKHLLKHIAATLWEWDVDDEGREIVPVSPEAKALYVRWHNSIAEEAFLAQNSALLRKLQAHALRLCLLLYSLDAALSCSDGKCPVPKDCMRRALLLADWVKAHQVQCWQFFTSGKTKQADPIERAIMEVIVEDVTRIEADRWRMESAYLHFRVEQKIGMSGLLKDTVAKAVSRLGLGSCWMNKRRARKVPRGKIESFKKAVVGVVAVASPYKEREKPITPAVAQVLSGVVAPSCATPETTPDNSTTTSAVVEKSLEIQEPTTATTAATPVPGDNLQVESTEHEEGEPFTQSNKSFPGNPLPDGEVAWAWWAPSQA